MEQGLGKTFLKGGPGDGGDSTDRGLQGEPAAHGKAQAWVQEDSQGKLTLNEKEESGGLRSGRKSGTG